MATGLTFGSIAALFGLTHHLIDETQYTELVTVVILSAFVPTLIAQLFFRPTGRSRRRSGRGAAEPRTSPWVPSGTPKTCTRNRRRYQRNGRTSRSQAQPNSFRRSSSMPKWWPTFVDHGLSHQVDDFLSGPARPTDRGHVDGDPIGHGRRVIAARAAVSGTP